MVTQDVRAKLCAISCGCLDREVSADQARPLSQTAALRSVLNREIHPRDQIAISRLVVQVVEFRIDFDEQ